MRLRLVIQELVSFGYLEEREENYFWVTDDGYVAADRLAESAKFEEERNRLSDRAVELLRAAGAIDGLIRIAKIGNLHQIIIGMQPFKSFEDHRDYAFYSDAIEELRTMGFLKSHSNGLFELTSDGYLYLAKDSKGRDQVSA